MRYLHEVWEDPADISHTFICPASPWAERSRQLLSASAKVIGTFEAGSPVEAVILFYRFMGWEEYTTSDLDDSDPYPDDWSN